MAVSGGPGLPGDGGGSITNNGPFGTWLAGVGYYQVVREGVYISGQTNLTNNVLSGTIGLPFEAGNDVGTITEAVVQDEFGPFAGAESLIGPPTCPWIFSVDTAFFENGAHTLQAEVGWLNPDISDANNFAIHQFSMPVSITVSNAICYPNWEPEIGELGVSAYFAETVYTNANWNIEIFDVSNNLVQTLAGEATNGLIEGYWNMVDTNGVTRTNADADPIFNATITVSPVSMAAVQIRTPAKKQRPNNFPSQGTWAIAYQDNFGFMANSNRYFQAIFGMGNIGQQYGGAYTINPPAPGQTNGGQTFPLRYPNTNAAAFNHNRCAVVGGRPGSSEVVDQLDAAELFL